jgi:hypothetical protein
MMFTHPPGPRSALKIDLLMAISDGCEEIRYRRVRGGYEMCWLVKGTEFGSAALRSGSVRHFAGILWQLAHGRLGLAQRTRRFVRRFGGVVERGVFDFPVGPEFVVTVSYTATWCRGRMSELAIVLGASAALVASGIARLEYDLAWHGSLRQ